MVATITDDTNDYAREVYTDLLHRGYQVELDTSKTSLNKKVRNGQNKQFNYILVVGKEEAGAGVVDVRDTRNQETPRHGKKTIDDFVSMISDETHFPPGVSKPRPLI